jgi:plasmid maintenance system killer protein
MKIRDFAHKGLERLYAEDILKGVPPETVDKPRKMLAYLDNMENPEELRALTAWRAHRLTGDPQLSSDVPHRHGGARNLRRESGRLSPAQQEKLCP